MFRIAINGNTLRLDEKLDKNDKKNTWIISPLVYVGQFNNRTFFQMLTSVGQMYALFNYIYFTQTEWVIKLCSVVILNELTKVYKVVNPKHNR